MRFHVIALPHTLTTEAFAICAYTEKVRKFCKMMKGLGHEVFLYAGETNEAPCDELIPCIFERERRAAVGSGHYVEASFDSALPHWQAFNMRARHELGIRLQPQDFICVIAGIAHKPIADAFPNHMVVEFGIGYSGTFAKYRVWESYAWMHACYGAQAGAADRADGFWYDAVIPSYIEREKFPFRAKAEDYFLYIGRKIDRKGYKIAQEVCDAKGVRLISVGPGFKHTVGPVDRARLMGGARAIFVPTIYLEPFGTVHVEAMACGTPVICTDWGVFTETISNGINGFRCRSFEEFCTAVDNVDELDRQFISTYALDNYSLEAVAPLYETYFHRLTSLWGAGWYQRSAA